MKDEGKFNLLGVKINAIDYEGATQQILESAKNKKTLGVSALAVHGLMTGVMDDDHRHRLNHLELVVPDGQPVRWGVNLLHGTGMKDRVYGPNLMLKVCEAAAENEIRASPRRCRPVRAAGAKRCNGRDVRLLRQRPRESIRFHGR